MDKIIAIVPTYNRVTLFKRLVESVYRQTHKPSEIYALDNGSTDGTSELLKTLSNQDNRTPKFVSFSSSENLGAAKGMSLLLKKAIQAHADWIWVLDDDACLYDDTLEQLIKCKEFNDKDVYILESTIVDENNEWTPPNRPSRFDAKSFTFHGLTKSEYDQALNQGTTIPVNTGGYCGLLIRRQALEEFGFPNTDFYFWLDDIEYVIRVSQKKKVCLVPQSKIQHFAQGLVPHEKKWPFNGPLPKIPENLLWRYYYLNRNWLFLAKQYLPPHKYALFFSKQMVRNFAAPVLFRQNRIGKRWFYQARAGFDALVGRLGKTVNPD